MTKRKRGPWEDHWNAERIKRLIPYNPKELLEQIYQQRPPEANSIIKIRLRATPREVEAASNHLSSIFNITHKSGLEPDRDHRYVRLYLEIEANLRWTCPLCAKVLPWGNINKHLVEDHE